MISFLCYPEAISTGTFPLSNLKQARAFAKGLRREGAKSVTLKVLTSLIVVTWSAQ